MTANKTMMQNVSTFSILSMAVAVHQYYVLISWGLLTKLSKRICPESCFFIVYQQFLCNVCSTQGSRNILLICRTVLRFFLVFVWADT